MPLRLARMPGPNCCLIKWRLVMNTITLVILMCILILVLAVQVQLRQTNKKIDEFTKRMGTFMADATRYASLKK